PMSRKILAGMSVLLFVVVALLSRAKDEPPREPVPDMSLRAIGAMHPRLSPDGQRVAFSYQGAIWMLPASGGIMKRLSDGEGLDVDPAWSPDGKRIAYVNSRNLTTGPVRIINDDGTPVALPGGVQASGKIAFHPDGQRILGSLQGPDLKAEALAWVDLTTGKTTPVTDPPRPARRAALSADGKWIAFATNQDVPGQQGGNDGPQADLWKVSADGGKPEKIVQFPARIYDLCWSADGDRLIATTDLGGAHYDLWQVPIVDSLRGAKQLTFGQADEE